MSGHSKWSNIQHRKGAQDKKRAKIFTTIIRELTIAARMGGGDINANPRLRLAVDKAFANNMPKDTVERAIKRGAGGLEGQNMEDVTYEGYGPNGVAILVQCATDNRNRTVAEVRHGFTKFGGNLGTEGSVSYLFSEKGQMTFAPGSDEEKIMEIALDAGADDIVTNEDGSIDVMTTPETFADIKEAFEKAKLTPAHAEVTMIASTEVALDKEGAEKLLKMVDHMEELDDVQEVYTNADISEDIMSQIS